MRRLLTTSCLVLAMMGLFSVGLFGQESLESLGNSVAWRVSNVVPAGSIQGMVLSGLGDPLASAQVFVGEERGVVTGRDGRFTLRRQVGESVELRIVMIGFEQVRETIVIPADHGIFLTAIVRPQSVHGIDLCSFYDFSAVGGTPPGDIAVQVVDRATGRPPDAMVTIRVAHESGMFENTVRLRPMEPPQGWVGLGHRIETEGSHSIEVSAPGYRKWRRDDVQLKLVPGCMPTLLNRVHRAELIRADQGAR